jgi:hypothetical protein
MLDVTAAAHNRVYVLSRVFRVLPALLLGLIFRTHDGAGLVRVKT